MNTTTTKIYLSEYEIEVKQFLDYADIQQIVNSTIALSQSKDEETGKTYNSWAQRQQNIDMLLLLIATNISDKELQKYTHREFLQSGLIQAVKQAIVNYNDILVALSYTESFQYLLTSNMDKLNSMIEKLKTLPNIKNTIYDKDMINDSAE